MNESMYYEKILFLNNSRKIKVIKNRLIMCPAVKNMTEAEND
jgi:hypothetical protein